MGRPGRRHQGQPVALGHGGFKWETIFDRANRAGLTARYYYSDLPFAALYGSRGTGWTHPVADFYTDAAAGKLPNIAFVDPPSSVRTQGTSGDEHPHGDIRVGQAFMSDVVHAFMESPQYRRGSCSSTTTSGAASSTTSSRAHVPDGRQNRGPVPDYGLTGFRIPGGVRVPFSRKGGVNHMNVPTNRS